MLAAYPNFQALPSMPTLLDRNPHQAAHSINIDRLEGISRQDFLCDVCRQKRSGVVSTEPVRHLREIVRSE